MTIMHVAPVLLAVMMTQCWRVEGGCSRGDGVSSLCCDGKNNSCVAQGAQMKDENSRMCFCDSNCVHQFDCCTDYHVNCQKIDCILSDTWTQWSECDTRCGYGTTHRTRRVLVEAQNGGRPCDVNVEKLPCEGIACKVTRVSESRSELKETARIVSTDFAYWRKDAFYNPYADIRRNLFDHYFKEKLQHKWLPYCVKYELTEVSRHCSTAAQPWARQLTRGAAMCVDCQPQAMRSDSAGRCRGQGVLDLKTAWKAVAVPGCHGRWVMKKRYDLGCTCDTSVELSFVFV